MKRTFNRLYLVRHGQTQSNLDSVVMGSVDQPLTEEGEKQAVRLRPFLAAKRLDRAYCSPMTRTQRTAELIQKDRDLSLATLDGLKEQDYGQWEGTPYRELERSEGGNALGYYLDPENFTIPGGEPFADFSRRVVDSFETIIGELKESENALIVSHGGPIRILLCHLLDLDYSKSFFRFWMDNASVTVVDYFAKRFAIMKKLNWLPDL